VFPRILCSAIPVPKTPMYLCIYNVLLLIQWETPLEFEVREGPTPNTEKSFINKYSEHYGCCSVIISEESFTNKKTTNKKQFSKPSFVYQKRAFLWCFVNRIFAGAFSCEMSIFAEMRLLK